MKVEAKAADEARWQCRSLGNLGMPTRDLHTLERAHYAVIADYAKQHPES